MLVSVRPPQLAVLSFEDVVLKGHAFRIVLLEPLLRGNPLDRGIVFDLAVWGQSLLVSNGGIDRFNCFLQLKYSVRGFLGCSTWVCASQYRRKPPSIIH